MNAKKELLEHIEDRAVEYVQVIRVIKYNGEQTIQGTLNDVLSLLDFEYNNGFGSQVLRGTIWYADGTWSDRRVYDGSEWWEHHQRPPLPNAQAQR